MERSTLLFASAFILSLMVRFFWATFFFWSGVLIAARALAKFADLVAARFPAFGLTPPLKVGGGEPSGNVE